MLIGTFNQEKALVVAFSVIVKLGAIFGNLRLSFQALVQSTGLQAVDTGRCKNSDIL